MRSGGLTSVHPSETLRLINCRAFILQYLSLNFAPRIKLAIIGLRCGDVTIVLRGVSGWNYSPAGLIL